jgi:hypothetical protein
MQLHLKLVLQLTRFNNSNANLLIIKRVLKIEFVMPTERELFLKSTRCNAIVLGTILFGPLLFVIYHYDGTCTPMLDGPTRSCSLSKYAYNEMIWASLLNPILIPISLGVWGYNLGRYLKFVAGQTQIARLLPFFCTFIGTIIGFTLGIYFPEIVRWAFSKAGL